VVEWHLPRPGKKGKQNLRIAVSYLLLARLLNPFNMVSRKGKQPKRQQKGKPLQVWARSGPVFTPSTGGVKLLEHSFIARSAGPILSIQGNVVTPILGAQAFTFSQVAIATQVAALYDSYRIDAVTVQFQLRTNPVSAGGLPKLTLYPDFDDATAASTLGGVNGHPQAVQHIFSPTRPEYAMTISPRPALAAYQGAFTGYAVPDNPVWCDSANPTVQHYGYKYAVENMVDTTQYIDVYYKFWFTARNPI
jgi:hypothetical protein